MSEERPSVNYRARTPQEYVQLQVRILPDLRDRLNTEASRRLVSMNLLVEKALEEAVAKWEQQSLT